MDAAVPAPSALAGRAGDRWQWRGIRPRFSGVKEIAGIPDCRSQDADLAPWEGGKAEARGSAEPGIAEQLLSYRL